VEETEHGKRRRWTDCWDSLATQVGEAKHEINKCLPRYDFPFLQSRSQDWNNFLTEDFVPIDTASSSLARSPTAALQRSLHNGLSRGQKYIPGRGSALLFHHQIRRRCLDFQSILVLSSSSSSSLECFVSSLSLNHQVSDPSATGTPARSRQPHAHCLH
jgi:hypothetical protein